MKVVVIIPTYNERENIRTLLDLVHRTCEPLRKYQFSYLVVDDTSPDGTAAEVQEYRKTHPSVHLLTGKKEGLGRALLRGMTHAVKRLHAEVMVQLDGDLSHDVKKLPEFFDALDKGYDFVVGSRYIPGGGIPENWGLHRKIYSVLGNAFVRFGLGLPAVHDWTGGYRLYKRKYYEALAQTMETYNGYVFQIAFLHKSILLGARVWEVPFHFTDRRYGHSKIAPSEYIRNVVVYVIQSRLRSMWHGTFGKFLLVGGFGFLVNTVVLEWMVWAGGHPAVGSALGAECAIISNFILNNNWTFRQRKIGGNRLFGKFFQFNAASLGALIIQAGMVAVGVWLSGKENYRVFYVIGVGVGLLWNYTMYKRFIWKRHDEKSA